MIDIELNTIWEWVKRESIIIERAEREREREKEGTKKGGGGIIEVMERRERKREGGL